MSEEAKYQEQLQEWREKFDLLSLRERGLVLAIAITLVVSVVQVLLIDPLLTEREKMHRKFEKLSEETQELDSRQQILNAELIAGVNRSRLRQAEQMEDQLQKLDTRIEQSLVTMIPPKLMTQVLENVLAQDDEITLIGLENLPVKAIIKREAEAEAADIDVAAVTSGLYRHGFVLTLRGTYPATVRYFESLSELPWQFHWDDLHYEVNEYPDATITLQVHTVSMSEDWIGV